MTDLQAAFDALEHAHQLFTATKADREKFAGKNLKGAEREALKRIRQESSDDKSEPDSGDKPESESK